MNRPMKIHQQWLVLILLACSTARCPAEWFSEIEVRSEPEANGQKDYTVRFKPIRTHQCDHVLFECVYRQELPWVEADGQKSTRIHEPVRHSYRRTAVKFVNDLDNYISFRVPVSLERLQQAFGLDAFDAGHPITVPRMWITGATSTQTLWRFEVRTDATNAIGDAAPPDAAADEK
jgi:hypothetical protein